jgi:hypothetical protein
VIDDRIGYELSKGFYFVGKFCSGPLYRGWKRLLNLTASSPAVPSGPEVMRNVIGLGRGVQSSVAGPSRPAGSNRSPPPLASQPALKKRKTNVTGTLEGYQVSSGPPEAVATPQGAAPPPSLAQVPPSTQETHETAPSQETSQDAAIEQPLEAEPSQETALPPPNQGLTTQSPPSTQDSIRQSQGLAPLSSLPQAHEEAPSQEPAPQGPPPESLATQGISSQAPPPSQGLICQGPRTHGPTIQSPLARGIPQGPPVEQQQVPVSPPRPGRPTQEILTVPPGLNKDFYHFGEFLGEGSYG